MGEELRVYSTPSVVLDIERLDNSKSSAGTRVEIDHLDAALINMWLDIETSVEEIDRRRVLFKVVIYDQVGDKVGEYLHTRFIVDLEKQKKQLDAKRAKLRIN